MCGGTHIYMPSESRVWQGIPHLAYSYLLSPAACSVAPKVLYPHICGATFTAAYTVAACHAVLWLPTGGLGCVRRPAHAVHCVLCQMAQAPTNSAGCFQLRSWLWMLLHINCNTPFTALYCSCSLLAQLQHVKPCNMLDAHCSTVVG